MSRLTQIGIEDEVLARHRAQNLLERAEVSGATTSPGPRTTPTNTAAAISSSPRDRRPAPARRRLAARAGLRVGAGLVTVASPQEALAVNAAHLTAIMLRAVDGPAQWRELLMDKRFSAAVLGPAFGVGEATQEVVESILAGVGKDQTGVSASCSTPTPQLRLKAGRIGWRK